MGLILSYAYQHSDVQQLQPVTDELIARGHTVMIGTRYLHPFLEAIGPRCLLLCADYLTFEHAEGLSAVKQSAWREIPSISIQHGFPFMREPVQTTAGMFCLWHEYWSDQYQSLRQAVTGAPSMDRIKDYDRDAARCNLKRVYGLNGQPLALLTPQVTFFPVGEEMTIEQAVERNIADAQAIGFDGSWLVRPHPSDTKYTDRLAAVIDICEALDGELQMPGADIELYDILACAELVAGTSSVVLEGAAFGAEPRFFWVDIPPLDEVLKPVDGKAASRVADIVERAIDSHDIGA